MATKYTKDHEWIDVNGDVGTVGITNHAQEQLGELVYVELPEVGAALDQGDEAGVVESVKAASDVYAPISGEVLEINENLADAPELLNQDPYGEGWMYKLKPDNIDQIDDLLDADGYEHVLSDD